MYIYILLVKYRVLSPDSIPQQSQPKTNRSKTILMGTVYVGGFNSKKHACQLG